MTIVRVGRYKRQTESDYQEYCERIYEIGIELNYVAHKLHALRVNNVQKYDEAGNELYQCYPYDYESCKGIKYMIRVKR